MSEIAVVYLTYSFIAAIFFLVFLLRKPREQEQEPQLVVLNESEVRRILIWHHVTAYECLSGEEDDKLASNLRELFKLSPDVQEYPEWD